ncbi:hypothetical protein [Azospirillum sp. sgz302134]
MTAADVFALSVLALGVGALGLSVVHEAARITAVGARTALARGKIQARTEELKALKGQIADVESRADLQQATFERLAAERGRINGLINSIKASKVAVVHELGDPESGGTLYECDLRTVPDFNRIDPRNLLFAREIWDRRNIAHVWADTPEAAQAAVQRAFTARSGVLPTKLQRAEFTGANGGANGGADGGGSGSGDAA